MNQQIDHIVPIFFGVWIVLGIGSAAFFFLNHDAALKRKVHPPFVVFVGVLFLAFVALMGFARDPFFFVVMVPAVILISLLNIRNTRFCDGCGKTIYSHNPFTRPRYCSKCGANLNTKQP